MRALLDLEVAHGLSDNRRIRHARELDQIEITVVVDDRSVRTASAYRLGVSLDIDQCRAGEIGAETRVRGR